MAEAKDKGGKAAKTAKDSSPPKGGGKPEPKTKGRPTQSEVAAAGKVQAAPKDYVARLKAQYDQEIVARADRRSSATRTSCEVPKIDKIVLNMGVGEAVNDTKKVTSAANDLALIAGQKPVVTRARKAISTFKVRENMPIGAKVTLRKTRMYEFLDRLVTIALPRVRDFRGLDPKSFDGRGNYAMGVKEHIIFPEIDYDKAESMLGHGHRGLHDGQDRRRGAGSAARLQFPVPAVNPVSLRKEPGSNADNRRPLMAKKSAIENNLRKQRMVKKFAARRQRLLDIANSEANSMEERFEARLKLAELPRNGAAIRVRNRCEVTGRPRAFYRKLKMCAHRVA